MMTPAQRDQVTTGYQDTTTGRRCAPVAHWSDQAFRNGPGIDRWLRSPTAPQRRLGITGFDEHGRAIYGGQS